MTRKALGKGLSALLRDVEPAEAAPTAAPDTPPTVVGAAGGLSEIALELIDASPFQPRAHFNPQSLEELARSMRSGGVVQPVIARRIGTRYELVTGERRLRAARLAGLQSIPTIVRPLSDQQALEISLLENIQREDLNPLEQARAFERLANEFALTQEEIAKRTGKDRATIANLMRLLRLPKEVQELVEQGKLTAGHARALLKLEESPVVQRVLARRMAARRISVRQAEQMVERKLPTAKKKRAAERPVDPNLQAAQEALERALGTKVRVIEQKGGRGRIEIDYYSLENLDHIYYTIVGTEPKRPI